MEQVIAWVIVGTLSLAAVWAWWLWRQRSSRSNAVTDEPVDEVESREPLGADEPAPMAEKPAPLPFDRAFLTNRSRVLDPSKWDNTPELSLPPARDEADDLPRTFDRDYLARRRPDPS